MKESNKKILIIVIVVLLLLLLASGGLYFVFFNKQDSDQTSLAQRTWPAIFKQTASDDSSDKDGNAQHSSNSNDQSISNQDLAGKYTYKKTEKTKPYSNCNETYTVNITVNVNANGQVSGKFKDSDNLDFSKTGEIVKTTSAYTFKGQLNADNTFSKGVSYLTYTYNNKVKPNERSFETEATIKIVFTPNETIYTETTHGKYSDSDTSFTLKKQ